MDIMIRSRFDSVERAEACVKRIRESGCPVVEIRLIAPRQQETDTNGNVIAAAPLVSSLFAGTVGFNYGLNAFAMRADEVNETGDSIPGDDTRSRDATVEVVAPPQSKERIRGIIVNAGGRDTEEF